MDADELQSKANEIRRLESEIASGDYLTDDELIGRVRILHADLRRFERRMFAAALDGHLRAYRGYGLRATRPSRDSALPVMVSMWSPCWRMYDRHFYPRGYHRHLDAQLLALEA